MKTISPLHQIMDEISRCQTCAAHLPFAPRPVIAAHPDARLLIIGQAPGMRVQESGIPWNDPSGELLRKWLQMTRDQFYDARNIAIVPMGLCYPGKGGNGDLPPRRECAPLWHDQLLSGMSNVRLTLLIGSYSQRYYLREQAYPSLTDTVAHFANYLPDYFPLPHPSPRNRHWFVRHPWFEKTVLPALRASLATVFEN